MSQYGQVWKAGVAEEVGRRSASAPPAAVGRCAM